MSNQITVSDLKSLLSYSPDTGEFVWAIDRTFGVKAGSIAGWVSSNGYKKISIKNNHYLAHRLAWLYVYGELPSMVIDHIDGNRLNNKIENLRDVTHSANMQNLSKARVNNKSSGLLGVHYCKARKKYRARIGINKQKIELGFFETPDEAHKAYMCAKEKLHISNRSQGDFLCLSVK